MTARKIDAALLSTMLLPFGVADVEISPSRALSLCCSRVLAMSLIRGVDEAAITNRVEGAGITGHLAPEVARTLLDELDAHENTWKPNTVLAVARAAERALSLSERDIPQLLFRAIKEQASALKLLGRFDEALRETERAEAEAARTEATEFNVAIVRYCRAFILCEVGRTLEATSLLTESRITFAKYGDAVRMEKAVTFEATILYREKRYDEAMALYRGALMAATERGDEQRAALELGHIGHCYTRKGDLKSAREYLSAASGVYRKVGMLVPAARLLRSLARITFRESGRTSLFDDAAATFNALGMIGEWALTLLAHAEEVKERDAGADVSDICRKVYVRASRAAMVVTAAEALEMLVDSARASETTPDLVRMVAASIDAAAMEIHEFAVN